MKTVILVYGMCLFALYANSGCKKSEQEVQVTPTLTAKEKLLTESAWVRQKYETEIPFAPGWYDWFPTEPSYTKDDKYIFKANKVFEVNTSELPPPGYSPNTVISRLDWSLTDNETKLIIQGRLPAVIETLNSSSLVLFYPDTITGMGFDKRVTYRR